MSQTTIWRIMFKKEKKLSGLVSSNNQSIQAHVE